MSTSFYTQNIYTWHFLKLAHKLMGFIMVFSYMCYILLFNSPSWPGIIGCLPLPTSAFMPYVFHYSTPSHLLHPVLHLPFPLRVPPWGWKDGSVLNSTSCSCRGTVLSQYTHGGSQPAPGEPTPSFDFYGHMLHIHTYTQAKHSYMQNKS